MKVGDGQVIMPEPILVGRSEAKLAEPRRHGGGLAGTATTDLDAALADPRNVIYFDAQTTGAPL